MYRTPGFWNRLPAADPLLRTLAAPLSTKPRVSSRSPTLRQARDSGTGPAQFPPSAPAPSRRPTTSRNPKVRECRTCLPPAPPPRLGAGRPPRELTVAGLRGSALQPESRPGAARGREGAALRAPPRLVPLPRPARHSRIFTRRWSRRAAAVCRASRRRCSAAVRWPSEAAWPSSSPKMSPAQRDRSASCSSRQTRACELTCSSERKSGAPAAPAAWGRCSRAGSTVLWWKGMAGGGRHGLAAPRAARGQQSP